MNPLHQKQSRLLATLEGLLQLQATEVKPALDQAALLVAEVLGADKADVLLHDPAIDSLVALGTSDTPMGRKQKAIGLDRMPVANGGRTVEVFQSGNSFITGHADEDPGELPGIINGLGIRSTLAAPLEAAGNRRGVLLVSSATPESFSDADLRFLEAVAGWMGMVLHRAELVEQLARDAAAQGRRAAAEEIVTVLAHDLRNYMTPLRGRSALIRRRAERDGRQRDAEDAAALEQALERMNRMIEDLLDVGRLSRGLFSLTLQLVDLAALVREAVDTLQEPGATIDLHLPPEGLKAAVDDARVRQAVENLLVNAVKHAPAGTPVRVALAAQRRQDGLWAELTVMDSGRGVPADLLPHLFQPFVSGPGSTGLGLGLYLAHSIAEAHGGTLTVASTPDKGTRFTLSLPLRHETKP